MVGANGRKVWHERACDVGERALRTAAKRRAAENRRRWPRRQLVVPMRYLYGGKAEISSFASAGLDSCDLVVENCEVVAVGWLNQHEICRFAASIYGALLAAYGLP